MGSQATDALFAESIGVLVSGKPGTEADSKPASPATLFSGFTYKIEDVDGKAGYEKTIKLVYEGPDKPLHPLSKVVSLTRVNFYKPISLQTFTAER
ncbi:MAG: hypothetical protein HY053_06495 [Proteobacteria bacterium]|nr:hypothetical protein [Pseudomonadota bacterium]